MTHAWQRTFSLVTLFWATSSAVGGGSGLNVLVVVNQNSANSVQLGNYYCEQRQVPPQNFLRINWPGSISEWAKTNYETYLRAPLVTLLADRQLTNQVDYIVLSLDIPYRVVNAGPATQSGANSTTSALFYGFKPDYDVPSYNPASCNLPAATLNAYAGSEGLFRSTPPSGAGSNSWLVTMLTSSNLALAKLVVDHGVTSDATFPTQKVYLAKSTDIGRNIRYVLFDDAIFNTRLRGNYAMARTNVWSPSGLGRLLGYENGVQIFGAAPGTFERGAMADVLTSFGGKLYEPNDHTTLLALLDAAASGSYGTIIEPCAWLQKFPAPQNYFYQARGFSLAECYYQSVANPHQGLLVGEPLAAPFALPASGAWPSLPPLPALAGTTNLSVQFTAPDATRPVQQVDLFLDGKLLQTLTNIPPRQNNVLTVTLNGQAISYTVPASATLKSVAAGLATEINKPANTNATRVRALTHGDRLELQSFQPGRPGSQVTLAVSNAVGSATALTTFLVAARTNFLDTAAWGWRNYSVTGSVLPTDYLQLIVLKTNTSPVTLTVTNPPGNFTTSVLVQSLVDAVNTNASLQQPDGLVAEDFIPYEIYLGQPGAEFNLRARTPGWAEAQLTVTLSGSLTLSITPAGPRNLDEQVADLMPRNHLHVTAGLTNLPVTFAFNTSTQADGFHELTAVAYEGSHVRTQKRLPQAVRLTNSPLAATFTTLVGGSTTLVTATLQFAVAANTNTISRLELFSTGGLLAFATNQASVTFSVPGTNLHVGLHPFYAIVTRNDGRQYRTETKWIRLVATDYAEPPFPLTATAPPPVLAWPATVGRTYQVLSATNVTGVFQLRAAFPATNSPTVWAETNLAETLRFYRVRALP